MQQKLKYIELFENYTNDGVKIPYSKIDSEGKLNIKFPKSVKSINPKFNLLTTEVTGELSIDRNTVLKTVTGFNQLQEIGWNLWIEGNTVLETVTGFESLQSVGRYLWISDNPVLETVTGFKSLQSVGWGLLIEDNPDLHTLTGFNQLQSVGWNLLIWGNTVLKTVTGFNQLQKIGNGLWIRGNLTLVTLSIPSTLIRSVNYKNHGIKFEDEYIFESPEEFVNHDVVIQDCIDKFDPGLHGDIVVTQILENVNTWGTPATQGVIINHLLSKGNYWSFIPENLKHLAEDHYKYLYDPEFKNTGAKSVAKVATGVTYGLF